MVTQAYVYKKDNKFLWTFASYDEKEEVFSDRNVFPRGCIIKMEKDYSLIFFGSGSDIYNL